MALGVPPRGSSPAKQRDADLNRDATLHPSRSEVENQDD